MDDIDFQKLNQLIDDNDHIHLAKFIKENGLALKDGKIVSLDRNLTEKLKAAESYWDQRNLAKKTNLNAAYGALTNQGSRFCDQRIGQSTTLSGRVITRHMNAKINELLCGVYDYKGECIKYSDTDSSYFSIETILKDLTNQGFTISRDSFVELSNNMAELTNDSFPEFMKSAFNVSDSNKELIKCGREICAEYGLFIKKKKYALLYYDKENSRTDKNGLPGSLKIMGLETQRADTPKVIQEFLKDILFKVLQGETQPQIVDAIREFRPKVRDLKPWEKGTPKRANKLTMYAQKMDSGAKVKVPGHTRAAINWNLLRKMHNDNHILANTDGQKVIFCALKQNPLNFKSIAYPVDQYPLPEWFTSLPFDDAAMEGKLIDQKIDNIIGILKWDLSASLMSDTLAGLFEPD